MKYDLAPFYDLVEKGLLRKAETEDLVLFNYTDACTYERAWNEYTTIARGLILHKSTGDVIAKPFEKFYNLNEMPETKLENLPDLPYTVQDKCDGSLGIVFNYKGKWQVATRGSFTSPQAIKANQLLKRYDLTTINENDTLLCEIIYPDNKIIVDYGKKEKLVLLAAFNRDTCQEHMNLTTLRLFSDLTGMELVKSYNYSIKEMIALQKTLPKDKEGFVVRYSNGLRIKIKGEEYMKIARILSRLSPLSFWECMENGKVKKEYLEQIPEELRPQFEPIANSLEVNYSKVMGEILMDLVKLPKVNFSTPEGKKQIGLFVQGNNGLKHPPAVFGCLKNNQKMLDKYILKQIRPNGNTV